MPSTSDLISCTCSSRLRISSLDGFCALPCGAQLRQINKESTVVLNSFCIFRYLWLPWGSLLLARSQETPVRREFVSLRELQLRNPRGPTRCPPRRAPMLELPDFARQDRG